MAKTRINISLDQDLAEFAKIFAAENRTTVADMVTQYFLALNRHILDAGIAMFVSMLAYKAEEAGGRCVEVRPDAENAFTRRC